MWLHKDAAMPSKLAVRQKNFCFAQCFVRSVSFRSTMFSFAQRRFVSLSISFCPISFRSVFRFGPFCFAHECFVLPYHLFR